MRARIEELYLRDLRDLLDQQCFVKEPEHSLNIIKNFEQKYSMTCDEARASGLACPRDLAAWEHALGIVALLFEKTGGKVE